MTRCSISGALRPVYCQITETTGMLISGKMSFGMTQMAETPRNTIKRGQDVEGVRKFQRKSDDTHVVVLTAGGSSSFSDSLPYFKTRSARGRLNVHQEIDFDKLVQIAYTVRYSA